MGEESLWRIVKILIFNILPLFYSTIKLTVDRVVQVKVIAHNGEETYMEDNVSIYTLINTSIIPYPFRKIPSKSLLIIKI